LAYLQYWKEPEYAQYLSYPGPALKTLELLQQESFRKQILTPALQMHLIEENIKAKPPRS
jgi:mediator of RNA polymerase II transcription subunit 31